MRRSIRPTKLTRRLGIGGLAVCRAFCKCVSINREPFLPRHGGEESMRRIGVLIAVAVFAALASCVAAGQEIERLVVVQEDVVTVLDSGDALITRTEFVSPSPLSDLYHTHWEACEADPEVMWNYLSEMQTGYFFLLGREVEQPDAYLPTPETRVGFARVAETYVAQLAGFSPDEGLWMINLGPRARAMMEAFFEYTLDAMIFRSLYLESVPAEQEIIATHHVRFELPGAIHNREELEGLQWRATFGGGSEITAYVSVEGNTVVFMEVLRVTEEPPAKLLDASEVVFENFADYGVFSILYSGPAAAVPQWQERTTTALRCVGEDWSGKWGHTATTHITPTFSYDGFELKLDAESSVYIGAFLGWDFKTEWTPWPVVKLRWFKASIKVSPGLLLSVDATAETEISDAWSTNWESPSGPWIAFCVGTFPVLIHITAGFGVGALVDVHGSVGFSTGIELRGSAELGCEWRNKKWNLVSGLKYEQDFSEMTMAAGADGSVRGELSLSLAAYVYDLAGPFVEAVPYLAAGLDCESDQMRCDWSVDVGVDASGGVRLAGWLKDWLKVLGTYSTDFSPWVHNIAKGSWPPNNPPDTPSLPSGEASGDIGQTYTYTTSATDPDGDSLSYGWDWDGDGSVDNDNWVGATASHSWNSSGTYSVRVKAKDPSDAVSSWSPSLAVTISPPNQAPNTPELSGPTQVEVGRPANYSASTTDPNGDDISYGWDYTEDGVVDQWSAWCTSGAPSELPLQWDSESNQRIKVKAKDRDDADSGWSNELLVTVSEYGLLATITDPDEDDLPSGQDFKSASFESFAENLRVRVYFQQSPSDEEFKCYFDTDLDGVVADVMVRCNKTSFEVLAATTPGAFHDLLYTGTPSVTNIYTFSFPWETVFKNITTVNAWLSQFYKEDRAPDSGYVTVSW